MFREDQLKERYRLWGQDISRTVGRNRCERCLNRKCEEGSDPGLGSEQIRQMAFVASYCIGTEEKRGTAAFQWHMRQGFPEWLPAMIPKAACSRNQIELCVGGVTRMGYENLMEKAIGLALSCPFGVSTAHYRYATEAHFTDTEGKSSSGVNFGAYRREVLEEVGGADEEMIFADDDELNWRILKAGHRMFMNPEIKYFYYPRDSIRALYRQYFGYGRGRAMALKKHPDRLGLKHLIPSAFVLFLFFGLVLSLLIPWVWIPYVSILGLYAALSFFFSARIAAREGWKLFFVLPVLFIVIHLSYGLVFLRELILGHRPPKPATTAQSVK